MTLYFRFLWLIIKLSLFRRKMDYLHPFYVQYRVLPTDIDFFNFHLTNSRYPAFVDLVRTQFIAGSGIWITAKEKGWYPVAGAVYSRFRRDLRTFEQFSIKLEIVYISSRWLYLDYKFIKNGFVHCHVLEKWGLAHKGVGMVDPQKYLPNIPKHLGKSKPPTHIAKLMDAEDEFRIVVKKHTI